MKKIAMQRVIENSRDAGATSIIFAAMADEDLHFPGAHPEAWDASDPRRKNDCFAPPTEPCECYCLHCERVFSSDGIWFQKFIRDPAREKNEMEFDGIWLCPTHNCDGAGFTFDIFPTDPDHPANAGWHDDEDVDDEELDDIAAALDLPAPTVPPKKGITLDTARRRSDENRAGSKRR